MRIVLDTNCLIQSIPEKSPYFSVWVSVLNGKNTLCVTNEILEEYAEILQRLAGKETANDVLRQIKFPVVDVIALKDFLELLHG